KDGAFRLAIQAGVPILPLAVSGTGTALPKRDWRFGRSVAEVRVLEPIETTGLTVKDVPALRERGREPIQAPVLHGEDGPLLRRPRPRADLGRARRASPGARLTRIPRPSPVPP